MWSCRWVGPVCNLRPNVMLKFNSNKNFKLHRYIVIRYIESVILAAFAAHHSALTISAPLTPLGHLEWSAPNVNLWMPLSLPVASSVPPPLQKRSVQDELICIASKYKFMGCFRVHLVSLNACSYRIFLGIRFHVEHYCLSTTTATTRCTFACYIHTCRSQYVVSVSCLQCLRVSDNSVVVGSSTYAGTGMIVEIFGSPCLSSAVFEGNSS